MALGDSKIYLKMGESSTNPLKIVISRNTKCKCFKNNKLIVFRMAEKIGVKLCSL